LVHSRHRVAPPERPFGFGGQPENPRKVDRRRVPEQRHSDEVTGATLKDGETGGTWTGPASCWASPAAPDDGLAACIAKMPTAGTISDGSVNRNWTGPGELGQPGVRVLPEGKPV
jgi:hypothetical protein